MLQNWEQLNHIANLERQGLIRGNLANVYILSCLMLILLVLVLLFVLGLQDVLLLALGLLVLRLLELVLESFWVIVEEVVSVGVGQDLDTNLSADVS
jgi:hypothetical protein